MVYNDIRTMISDRGIGNATFQLQSIVVVFSFHI